MDWDNVKLRTIPGTCANGSKIKQKPIGHKKPLRSPAEQRDHDKVLHALMLRVSNTNTTKKAHPDASDYANQRRLVKAYRDFLNGLPLTHFVTFKSAMNANSRMTVKPESLSATITKFCCRLERKALKKKWSKFAEDRIRLIGFPEHPETNLHYHALLCVPEITGLVLEHQGEALWKALCPKGEFDVRPIYSIKGVVRYATKDLHHAWALENVAIYTPKTQK